MRKLFELCTEAEIEQEMNELVRIGSVITAFPEHMVEMAGAFDENSNNEARASTKIMESWGEWRELGDMTTKELQQLLKRALGKTETLDFAHRLGFEDYDRYQINHFRKQCKNVKLRHIYFRYML